MARPKLSSPYCDKIKQIYGEHSHEYKTYCKHKKLLGGDEFWVRKSHNKKRVNK